MIRKSGKTLIPLRTHMKKNPSAHLRPLHSEILKNIKEFQQIRAVSLKKIDNETLKIIREDIIKIIKKGTKPLPIPREKKLRTAIRNVFEKKLELRKINQIQDCYAFASYYGLIKRKNLTQIATELKITEQKAKTCLYNFRYAIKFLLKN